MLAIDSCWQLVVSLFFFFVIHTCSYISISFDFDSLLSFAFGFFFFFSTRGCHVSDMAALVLSSFCVTYLDCLALVIYFLVYCVLVKDIIV